MSSRGVSFRDVLVETPVYVKPFTEGFALVPQPVGRADHCAARNFSLDRVDGRHPEAPAAAHEDPLIGGDDDTVRVGEDDDPVGDKREILADSLRRYHRLYDLTWPQKVAGVRPDLVAYSHWPASRIVDR
jgi:hypothetical protein